MKRALIAGALTVVASAGASPAAVAQVIPGGCTFDSVSAVMTFSSDSPIALVREVDALVVNGEGCEGASVTNTDLIRLFADSITIDLAGGPLAPGATDEGDGSSEIELEIETNDLDMLATPASDHLVFGRANEVCTDLGSFPWSAVNLNANESVPDADILDCGSMFEQSGLSSVTGRGGNDFVSTTGDGMQFDLGGYLTVLGGAGDDTLRLGGGRETFRAGPGIDTLDASWATEFGPVGISVGGKEGVPPNVVVGGGYDAHIFGFERYIGSGLDDIFWGSSAEEEFLGGGGEDEAYGRGGGDLLLGHGGDDSIRGGGGDDLVSGGWGDDVLLGDGGSDTVWGLAGSDQLSGGAGNDFLRGGLDLDSCVGGGGSDRFRGCETRDTPNPG